MNNGSTTLFELPPMSSDELVVRVIGASFCIGLILATIFGNTLVIIVVMKFYRMRTVTNILLASLASADITVALLVMPFLVVYDFLRYWPFGPLMCHFWISCDVMCCTASILHLCAVAVDRFWAITRPLRYRTSVNKRRLLCAIAMIWLCSSAISFIPIFTGLYRDPEAPDDQDASECALKVNRIYAVVSSLTSFFLPLPIMFYVYFRILLIAERQARDIKQLQLSLNHQQPERPSQLHLLSESSTLDAKVHDAKRQAERTLRRRNKQLLTDTKAIRTLGMIMGVFCAFWLPFFTMYIVSAFCGASCDLRYEWRSALTWLGYVNSSINPIIYTFMNNDFKNSFRRVMCCADDSSSFEPTIALDDLSTTSRSMAPHQNRGPLIHFELTTPALSRTPSATPDMSSWPVVPQSSRAPSISSTSVPSRAS